MQSQKDNINPDHYKNQTSLECIEAMEIMFGKNAVKYFCLCNAFKYIWRWKNKNGKEDLDKARWYLHKANGFENIKVYEIEAIERMLKYITEAKKGLIEDEQEQKFEDLF